MTTTDRWVKSGLLYFVLEVILGFFVHSLHTCASSCRHASSTTSHPSLLYLPGPLTHPVLSPTNSWALCPEHQTEPGQFGPVSLQVVLGVSLQLVQGLRPALVQGHHSTQHGVEAEVHVWSQQIVQKRMDPFSVSSAADQVADFGPQAGGRGRWPLGVVIATGAKGQHTLEGLIGPQ